ncbi:MAG: asparagine synthase (glutamine-hydrolyzing) [Alphaproteobacteria bacterium]|nr:asparagine synthase (glutamine-hydrolyzing) [Alphaproteobacteria bacterium]
MCGVAGFWDIKTQNTKENNLSIVLEMTNQLKERGPDAFGIWSDEHEKVFLGHRRLSIIDLTELGAQPMISHTKRFVISYNGEVFNAAELAEELKENGVSFRGHSDTEVVLAACEVWGIEKACKKFNGMFAFSLWDEKERKLYLVRDRIGVKPFYWSVQNNIVFFGSQLKALIKHPQFHTKISLEALSIYFKFNYITAPHTIYQNVYKVKPGYIVTIDSHLNITETPFWQMSDFISRSNPTGTPNEMNLIDELETLLEDSVRKRMISDVPIGAFLSGGIDSSLVVALMQKLSHKPVKTFSIGFEESAYNEAAYAKEVAKHLQTDHFELYVSSKQALDIIPNLTNFYDEPFADTSQIPTYLVSRLAREQVTVCLSGDGGDELFCGYDRYQIARKLYPIYQFLPSIIKIIFAKGIRNITLNQWQKIVSCFPKKFQYAQIAEKGYKLSDTLNARTPVDFFQSFVSVWDNPSDLLLTNRNTPTNIYSSEIISSFKSPLDLMAYFDTKTFLPECVLTKVDRASMALSLEVRTPLLDYRVAEFSSKVPINYKVRDGKTKAPLRKILKKYIPNHLIERPKMGFSVPIGEWLKGDLREWSEHYLSQKSLESTGIFNAQHIQTQWQNHLSGKINLQYQLWSILMFQQWAEKYHANF